ncbi:MAG: hypothetical protein C5B51_31580 [Terriglobia bacterium]|nr:MAG: hypothetical protein C5B51_31580 [Terriglobia bacterium]
MNPEWHKPRPERLPPPSFAPPVMAAGLMCLLWGAVTSWVVSAIGLAIVAAAGTLWIRELTGTAEVSGRKEMEPAAPLPVTRAASTRSLSAAGVPVWYAAVLAAATFALVVLGAEVTSHQLSFGLVHRVLGALVGALTLGLLVWLRPFGWLLVGLAAVEAIAGGTVHAFLAHLFFAATVVIVLISSKGWKREPEVMDDLATPPLRSLCVAMVALAVLQVALGAAVRHRAMGPMLHIVMALIVALAILLVGVLVMNQCPTHRTLRPLAILMMTITGAQVFLGFAAFIVRMMAEESALPVVVSTVAHVATGALTLASTVIMMLQIRRHLRPAPARQSIEPVAP